MCYTAKDSLYAYIFNIVTSGLLYYNGELTDFKIIALFFAFVGQMQLFDYLFWTNSLCNQNNKSITKLAIIFNHLQPIVLYILIWHYKYPQSIISTIIIGLYWIFVIQYTIKLWPDDNCEYTSNLNSVCCSLPIKTNDEETIVEWRWNNQLNSKIIYGLFLLSLVSSSFDLKENKILFALISVSTYFISTKIPKLNQSIGRLWCYMASLMPGFILGYKIMLG